MRRRDLLTAAGASRAALAAPRIGRAERPNKLVFVPPKISACSTRSSPASARRAITPISSSTPSTASIRAGQRSLQADLDSDIARRAALSRQGAGART